MRSSSNRLHPSLLTSSIALAAVAFSAHAFAIQDCALNGESVNTSDGNATKGKTGLIRCKDRDSGVVQREMEVRNGVFMGVVRYYEQGRLSKEYQANERGNHDGLAREFAPDGKVVREENYRNGEMVGLSRTWYPGGQPRRSTWYAHGEKAYVELNEQGQVYGLRCGETPLLAPAFDDAKACGFNGAASKVDIYSGKGALRARASFLAGKRVRFEELYDNGAPAVVTEVEGNQRTERRWNESGVKVHETVSLMTERSSIKQSEKEFSDAGSLTREQRWSPTGEPLLDQLFYLNGQPKFRSVYVVEGGKRFTDDSSFSDNGQRTSQGRYALRDRYGSTPVGVHQNFDEHGTLVGESTYDDNGRLTRERSWDAGGKLLHDDAVFEDGSRKAYAK